MLSLKVALVVVVVGGGLIPASITGAALTITAINSAFD